jgi:hypothetical protein
MFSILVKAKKKPTRKEKRVFNYCNRTGNNSEAAAGAGLIFLRKAKTGFFQDERSRSFVFAVPPPYRTILPAK